VAMTGAARYLAEPPSLLPAARARKYDALFVRVLEQKRVAEATVAEAGLAWRLGRAARARACLERAEIV